MLSREEIVAVTDINIGLEKDDANRNTIVHCLRCGRVLTNPRSVAAKIGPKCARKVAWETRNQSISIKTEQYYKKNFQILRYKSRIVKKQPNKAVPKVLKAFPDQQVCKSATKNIYLIY